MTYTLSRLIFIETRLFTRIVGNYLSDDEYADLQVRLAADPEQGPVVPGTGGVRKLLTIYAKNEAQNIPAHVLRRIKEEIDA